MIDITQERRTHSIAGYILNFSSTFAQIHVKLNKKSRCEFDSMGPVLGRWHFFNSRGGLAYSSNHRPLNTGLRFSINAVIPSAWSSVSMLSAMRSASIWSWLSIERWFTELNNFLALA